MKLPYIDYEPEVIDTDFGKFRKPRTEQVVFQNDEDRSLCWVGVPFDGKTSAIVYGALKMVMSGKSGVALLFGTHDHDAFDMMICFKKMCVGRDIKLDWSNVGAWRLTCTHKGVTSTVICDWLKTGVKSDEAARVAKYLGYEITYLGIDDITAWNSTQYSTIVSRVRTPKDGPKPKIRLAAVFGDKETTAKKNDFVVEYLKDGVLKPMYSTAYMVFKDELAKRGIDILEYRIPGLCAN